MSCNIKFISFTFSKVNLKKSKQTQTIHKRFQRGQFVSMFLKLNVVFESPKRIKAKRSQFQW